MLRKYALVKNGIVQSTFKSTSTNLEKDFPDIFEYLHEVPEEVRDNWKLIAGVYIEPYSPDDLDGQNEVAEIKPWWKFWSW